MKDIFFEKSSWDNKSIIEVITKVQEYIPDFGYDIQVFGEINSENNIYRLTNPGLAGPIFFYTLGILRENYKNEADGFCDLFYPRLKINNPGKDTGYSHQIGAIVTNPFKNSQKVEVVNENYFQEFCKRITLFRDSKKKFYSTVILRQNHYLAIGIDFNDKIIYFFNPSGLGSQRDPKEILKNSSEENFGEGVKQRLEENKTLNKNEFICKSFQTSLQSNNNSCGLIASLLTMIFSLNGIEGVETFFYLYNRGKILFFSDLLSSLKFISTNKDSLKMDKNAYKGMKNYGEIFEKDFAKYIFNLFAIMNLEETVKNNFNIVLNKKIIGIYKKEISKREDADQNLFFKSLIEFSKKF